MTAKGWEVDVIKLYFSLSKFFFSFIAYTNEDSLNNLNSFLYIVEC
jgi:hypothetical protein